MIAGNGDRSTPPEGDNLKQNNSSDSSKSNDSAPQKPHRLNLDWREFRANLFAQEQVCYLSICSISGCFSFSFLLGRLIIFPYCVVLQRLHILLLCGTKYSMFVCISGLSSILTA